MTLPGVEPTFSRIRIAAPAPGNDWTYTIPSGTWIRLLAAFATLTTSSTVATRYAGAAVYDTAGVKIGGMEVPSPGSITASLTQKLLFMRAHVWDAAGYLGNNQQTAAINFPSVPIQPNYRISSSTPGMQPGDEYSTIQLWVQQWSAQPLFDSGAVIT
jgi:hypothetical protein